jgi:hypothetical protein
MAPTVTLIATEVLPGVNVSGAENIVVFSSSVDALTATAAGTITTSVLVTAKVNRFTTVASGAGTRLPPALSGTSITIYNAGANALSVFPASAALGGITGGDQINALGAGAAYSLTAGNSATYKCITTGQWYASQGALS